MGMNVFGPELSTGDRNRGEEGPEVLISRCLDHEESAWRILTQRYAPLLRGILVNHSVPPEDQSDIVQAVWLEVFCSLADLRNPQLFHGWLRTICTRTTRRWKLHRRRLGETVPIAELPSPVPLPGAERELPEEMSRAIALLPARCRTILHHLFFEDEPAPYAVVARRIGVSTGSIGFLRGRCLSKLKQVFLSSQFLLQM